MWMGAKHGTACHLLAVAETLSTGHYGWLLLEMLLVVAAIGVVGWLMVRLLARATRGRGEFVDILAHQTLEPRVNLYVIAVGEQTLLVGTSPDGVRTLATLDGSDLDAMELDHGGSAVDASFGEVLRRTLGMQPRKRTADDEPSPPGASDDPGVSDRIAGSIESDDEATPDTSR